MGAAVEVSHLNIVARAANGVELPIVNDVSFRIAPGEVLAMIGESGSGKTTIALALMGYARQGYRIAGGTVRIGETEVLACQPASSADCAGAPSPTSRKARRLRSTRPARSWTRSSNRRTSMA